MALRNVVVPCRGSRRLAWPDRARTVHQRLSNRRAKWPGTLFAAGAHPRAHWVCGDPQGRAKPAGAPRPDDGRRAWRSNLVRKRMRQRTIDVRAAPAASNPAACPRPVFPAARHPRPHGRCPMRGVSGLAGALARAWNLHGLSRRAPQAARAK
ncbi:uncharacterized protein AruCF_3991 [Achromobacter ruhlandii]|nr:uncharacterized protein AruCF_3991 [Achromobacter ruhlandii]